MTDFERQVVRVQKKLYTYALQLTHDVDRAKDLLQNTFLQILTNEHNYTNRNSLEAWAMVIMRHLYLNEERKTKSSTRPLIVGYDDIDDSSHCVAEDEETYTAEEISELIKALSPEQALMLYRHIEGYKYEEIAKELKLPTGTVKSRVFTAKKVLKKRLGRQRA